MRTREDVRQSRGAIVSALVAVLLTPLPTRGDEDKSDNSETFRVSAPVLCTEIRGYDDYEAMPKAEFTQHQKLLVYFRPFHFKTNQKGDRFEAYFTQSGIIHKRGAKAPLLTKTNLEFRLAADRPLGNIFLKNTYSLRGLKPGEYDYEIILRDEIGKSAPAVVRVPFTIITAAPEERAPKAAETK